MVSVLNPEWAVKQLLWAECLQSPLKMLKCPLKMLKTHYLVYAVVLGDTAFWKAARS